MSWKDIKGWETLYEVNENGEVRNKLTGNLIVGDINNCGYHRVCLYNKQNIPSKQRFFRHRLVAIHFIENTFNLCEVNHIDGDKSNNHVSNLEWCSRLNNERHAWETGLRGKKLTNKPIKVVYDSGDEVVYHSQREMNELTGISIGKIQGWLNRGFKTYPNYQIKSIQYV